MSHKKVNFPPCGTHFFGMGVAGGVGFWCLVFFENLTKQYDFRARGRGVKPKFLLRASKQVFCRPQQPFNGGILKEVEKGGGVSQQTFLQSAAFLAAVALTSPLRVIGAAPYFAPQLKSNPKTFEVREHCTLRVTSQQIHWVALHAGLELLASD